MEIIIISAAAENNIIGKDNTIPWHIPEDLKRFKRLTKGFPCIMGRKTYESLPFKPLPHRLNLILSSFAQFEGEGVVNCTSLEEAFDHCRDYEKVFICGGAELYRRAMEFAHTIELTRVHQTPEGDTLFPEIDEKRWTCENQEDHEGYSFLTYRRRES